MYIYMYICMYVYVYIYMHLKSCLAITYSKLLLTCSNL